MSYRTGNSAPQRVSRLRKKLLFQQEVLKKLSQEGCLVDTFIENQEGSLVTRDKDNIPYTLQSWYEGRECDTKSREDIIRSV